MIVDDSTHHRPDLLGLEAGRVFDFWSSLGGRVSMLWAICRGCGRVAYSVAGIDPDDHAAIAESGAQALGEHSCSKGRG